MNVIRFVFGCFCILMGANILINVLNSTMVDTWEDRNRTLEELTQPNPIQP